MNTGKYDPDKLPEVSQLRRELARVRRRKARWENVGNLCYTLAVAAAVAVLVAILALPILRIYGNSMTPTLREGDFVVSVKGSEFKAGDLVVFYLGNNVLVKRYIAGPGTWVEITEDGTILLDGQVLEEPYVTEKSLGICDLEFPYQVPEESYFLVGDHRETSVDSRHSSVGCISRDQMVGKIVFRVWPMEAFGSMN